MLKDLSGTYFVNEPQSSRPVVRSYGILPCDWSYTALNMVVSPRVTGAYSMPLEPTGGNKLKTKSACIIGNGVSLKRR